MLVEHTAVPALLRVGLHVLEAGLGKVVEIKLKGQLGEAEDCEKEMRHLNRIVRLDDEGISYEADPRHAEMLVRAIQEKASEHGSTVKHLTSPGHKSKDIDYEAVLDDFSQLDLPPNQDEPEPVFSLKVARPRRKLNLKVSIDECAQLFEVPAYSETYPVHPSRLVFTGPVTLSADIPSYKTVSSDADPFTGKRASVMQHRRSIVYPASRLDSIKHQRCDIFNSVLEVPVPLPAATSVLMPCRTDHYEPC